MTYKLNFTALWSSTGISDSYISNRPADDSFQSEVDALLDKMTPTVPNGGWLGWSQVLACFLMSFCSLGLLNAFGIFQSHYQNTLLSAYPSSSITWIGTIQGFLFNVVGIGTGRLYDNGHAASLVYVGSALNVIGLLATSFASTYVEIFFSLGLTVGLGSGILAVPSMAIVATYFDERKRPLATGISATGAALGGVVYPLLFRTLLNSTTFPWTVRSLAVLNVLLLLAACILVRPLILTPQPTPDFTNPAPFTIHSDTESTLSITKPPLPQPSKIPPPPPNRQLIDPTALHSPSFLLFSVSLFLLWLGIDIPFFFLPSFAQNQLRLPPAWGDYLLAIMNASAILGRLILGFAAMYTGAFATWQFSIGASCILLLCWVAVKDLAGIIVLVILYGGITTGVSSLVSAAMLVVSPDVSLVGTRLGMVFVLGGVGCLVGPPVAGAVVQTGAGYMGLMGFTAGVYFVAFGVAWAARSVRRKEVVDGLSHGDEKTEVSWKERSGSVSTVTTVGV